MNLYTIFEWAQLFERFCAFQRCAFRPHEVEQRPAPKTVDPLVPKIFYWNGAIAREGDRVPREIKRVALVIDDDLYLVRRCRVGRIYKRMRRGDDADLVIGAERLHHAIKQGGLGQRFIALNINNVLEMRRFECDLGNPIRPALMFYRRHRHFCAPIEGCFGDAHVVCRDNYRVQLCCAAAAFPDVPEKRFVCNKMQRFSWETRGSPTGRNYANCFTHLRRLG